MATFKGALVSPEAGAGGGEEGDIAGAADPHRLGPFVPDLIVPDEPLHDLGHDDCFVLADKSPSSLPLLSLRLPSIGTSKQATAWPSGEAARIAASGVKPGCPAASDNSG